MTRALTARSELSAHFALASLLGAGNTRMKGPSSSSQSGRDTGSPRQNHSLRWDTGPAPEPCTTAPSRLGTREKDSQGRCHPAGLGSEGGIRYQVGRELKKGELFQTKKLQGKHTEGSRERGTFRGPGPGPCGCCT